MRSKRTIKRKAKTAEHLVDSTALVSALRKANIPSRFIRPEVTLEAFPWGVRVGKWLRVVADKPSGKSLLICGAADKDMSASAMVTRTLVIRGKDALFVTLAELISNPIPPRQCEYLIVSGFYDGDFYARQGMPMAISESYKLSWMLWRMANDGTTLICYTTAAAGMANWWSLGALHDIFNREETLNL